MDNTHYKPTCHSKEMKVVQRTEPLLILQFFLMQLPVDISQD